MKFGDLMRAVCYPRVSSAQQRERNTVESQLRELPAFAVKQGWELVRPAEHYVDDGRSAKAGKLSKRTGLQKLLHDAALGVFDVVIMADIDRLTRSESLNERGFVLGALQDAGVRVASANTGEILDLDTDHGDLIASLKGYLAAADNRRKAIAIRNGKLTSALRGGKPTGPDPYGLRYDKPTNTWSIDPVRGPIVAEVLERVAAGESCITIACDLVARGVPSSGRVWNKNLVRDLVRSTHPIGEYVAHRKSRTIIRVPAIVDVALWQLAQDALTTNRRVGLRRTKRIYLLEGLALCGQCGAKMRMRTDVLERGKYFRPAVYVCTGHLPTIPLALRRNVPRCPAKPVAVVDADARVWASICRQIEDAQLPAELAAERLEISSDARTWETDATGYRDHLARLDKVEAEILVRFRRGAISGTALDAELAALRRERLAVRSQLTTAERARGAKINAQGRLDAATAMIERLRAKLATATPAERREIALTMIDPGGATFDGPSIRVELWIERPPSPRRASSAMVEPVLSSADHDCRLRIRLVA